MSLLRLAGVLVFVCSFSVVISNAQETTAPVPHFRPYVSVLSQLATSYEPGVLSVSGVEFWTKRALLDVSSSISTADKSYMRSGTNYGFSGSALWRFKKNIVAGGGTGWGKFMTSQWSKDSVHPFLTGGVVVADGDYAGTRLTATYLFAGTDLQNGVRGMKFGTLAPVYQRRLFFHLGIGTYSAYPTDCHVWGESCNRYRTASVELGLRIQR